MTDFFEQVIKDIDEQIAELETLIEQSVRGATTEIGAGNLLSIGEFQPTIIKLASEVAVDVIRRNALSQFLARAKQAIAETVEYTYDPLRDRLLNAIRTGVRFIVDAGPNGGPNANVEVDMSALGDIGMWKTAHETALNWIRRDWEDWRRPMPALAASEFWRKKIMGVEEGGREPGDETFKYADKYEQTIELRLAFLPPHAAPYWYLIEHGNQGTMGGDGIPYPLVPATRFVSNYERELRATYKNAYNRAYNAIYYQFERIVDAWNRLQVSELPVGGPTIDRTDPQYRIRKSAEVLGAVGVTPGVQALTSQVGDRVAYILNQVAVRMIEGERLPDKYKILAFVRDETNKLWEIYRTENNLLGRRYSLLNQLER